MSSSQPPAPPPPPLPPLPGSDPGREAARVAAKHRLASKLNFKRNLLVQVFLALVCVAIWALSGGGYFWPGWVFFALVVSGFWMWLNAYGPQAREPNEADIEAELRRQQGN